MLDGVVLVVVAIVIYNTTSSPIVIIQSIVARIKVTVPHCVGRDGTIRGDKHWVGCCCCCGGGGPGVVLRSRIIVIMHKAFDVKISSRSILLTTALHTQQPNIGTHQSICG